MKSLILLIGLGLLTGCGQKGSLYLPDQLPPEDSTKPCSVCQPATVTETETKKKDTESQEIKTE